MIKTARQLLRTVFCVPFLVLALGYGPAEALSPAQVSNIADHSIGRVYVENGTGTGFVISQVPGSRDVYFVTNQHVVQDFRDVVVVFGLKERVEALPGRVVVQSGGHDIAVIRLRVSKRNGYIPPALILANREIEKGEPVYALGFPGISDRLATDRFSPDGSETTLSDGIVSRVTNGAWEKHGPPLELIQHTAAINAGNSGGPLLDHCARVLGVNTASWSNTNDVYLSSSSNSLGDYLTNEDIPFLEQSAPCPEDTFEISPGILTQDLTTWSHRSSEAVNRRLPVWAIVLTALFGVGLTAGLVAVVARSNGSAESDGGMSVVSADDRVVLQMAAELPAGNSYALNLTHKMLCAGAILGREGRADLPIEAPKISRKHAKIYRENRKLMLIDLGSTNGTKVDGIALRPHTPVQITSKSELEIGGVRIRLRS